MPLARMYSRASSAVCGGVNGAPPFSDDVVERGHAGLLLLASEPARGTSGHATARAAERQVYPLRKAWGNGREAHVLSGGSVERDHTSLHEGCRPL